MGVTRSCQDQDVRARHGVFKTNPYTLHALLNIELDQLGTTSDLCPKDNIQAWDQACNVIFQLSFPSAWRFIFRHCFSSANLQLLELLECLGFFEATEPRDKVFVINHLESDIPLMFRPDEDYRASLGGVYAQFTRQIVKQTNNLMSLQFKQLELITPRSLEGIPTWAPDYRTGFELAVPNWYHAAGTTKASYSAGSNPSILSPRGFDIAQVHFVLDMSHLSRSFAQFPAYYAGPDCVFINHFRKPLAIPQYLEDYAGDPHISFDAFLQAVFHNTGEYRILTLAYAWLMEDPDVNLLVENWRGQQLIRHAISKQKSFTERSDPVFKSALARAAGDMRGRVFFFSDQGSLFKP